MISDVHYIELYIQGQLVELESQTSLNLRINNVLFNPTQTTTKQGEYSYSFDIPSTPKNDKIFNYANTLSKTNKFHARYPTQVYADGNLIFDGSLTIQKYNANEKKYTCNLVNIKINTLDEIFGEMKMTDLHWDVDFDGASSINSVNSDSNTKYFFPLASYGVFQKRAVSTDEVGSTYTPKHTLDKYNKWWVESFYPSLNMVETMRKAFENKGYSVEGSALHDPYISNIYCSCNLSSEQSPVYNLGNHKFGELIIRTQWRNDVTSGTSQMGSVGYANNPILQDLHFPYYRVHPYGFAGSNKQSQEEYNFSTIRVWNMMDAVNNPSGTTVTLDDDSYIYDPDEHLIVIPSDGWYKINVSCDVSLLSANTTFTATQWTTDMNPDHDMTEQNVTITRNLMDCTPIEIQLIRNYDDNIELIKGTKNTVYQTGDPSQQTYTKGGQTYQNKVEWNTDFPHQDLYGSKKPTKTEDILDKTYNEINPNGNFGGNRANKNRNTVTTNTYGYMHKPNTLMPYDQAVSTAFICGMSSMSDGTMAVMRDGYSWSKRSSVENQVFANVEGMNLVKKTSGGGTETVSTNYCKNEYRNSPNTLSCTNNHMQGYVSCCVYLQKNDVLELMAIQRDYGQQGYCVSADCTVHITAMSDRTKEVLKSDQYWTYYSNTEFPTKLNLFNFTNDEMKVSDWINNIKTAFNLEILQDGNNVEINTNQGIKKNLTYAIDVDDRVSSDEATSEYISYPRQMSVQYKIDTEEWGFELSVPQEHINDEDWFKWGDSGYTVINLSDDSYETKTQNTSTQFSYTWYDNFLWKEVLEDGTESETSSVTITIPTISKAEYMAEGYGYDEAMKHDGYSLTQRFWYRGQVSSEYVWLAEHMHEKVYLTYPKNQWDRFNLNYKDTEQSIVTEYFNISPMLASNYVTIDVNLTPLEYNDIKSGSLVHFDSDLYYTSEISGYDPSGSNPTQLKLIKKV